MRLDAMYQEIILDHYRNPHNKGLRDPHDGEAHHINPTCGDEVTLRVTLTPSEGDVVDGSAMVSDVSYDSMGCSISQASASVLTDLLIGKSVDEGMRVLDAFTEMMHSKGDAEPDEDVLEDAVAFVGVSKYPARIKCALLAWMAWKDATVQSMRNDSREGGDVPESAS
ncbi:nitrogen fixation NifU-like protein [Lipingzhangella halophila]|uniref:Nitrogen fixation NifU-like protein n=1 Tax=Lipingzhangella halophila TaxID=1783352 RepID=A0A7W7RI23_9ACTN|nr:SUF system NifU family Fe-S cluster assembly protein [Lipingzhangella halophila]MBB4932394.1 nitrogen fixation NifU-like protein [Lipingzhangella halophila]